ncbi:uncharacterized protein LOC118191194 [Stegodyphus dumicola]|uniref:uncharacterized protein LOC118191194 n=1 Tax=Stegodyphus dumicola TaxID=202533 RepID=UPI0015AFAA5C|nr:uncharacterized protein LOC118191194 [Stegodyphus dumicola]
MKWLIPFSLAFFGVVFCEEDVCLTSKFQQCLMLPSLFGQDSHPCKVARIVVECVQTAEKACQRKEDPNLKEFISVLEDICKEGSANNKKFIELFPCFQRTIDTSVNCAASLFKDINDEMVKDPEKVKEFTKDACRKLESIVTCFEKNVEDICTADVETFFHKLYSPILKMVKNICEEILNSDTSSSRVIS